MDLNTCCNVSGVRFKEGEGGEHRVFNACANNTAEVTLMIMQRCVCMHGRGRHSRVYAGVNFLTSMYVTLRRVSSVALDEEEGNAGLISRRGPLSPSPISPKTRIVQAWQMWLDNH